MLILFVGSIHATSPFVDPLVDFHKTCRIEANPILVEKKIVCPANTRIVGPEFKVTSFFTDTVKNDECGIANGDFVELGNEPSVGDFGFYNFNEHSERPTYEIKNCSDNVNNQSPNVFDKQNDDGGHGNNQVLKLLKSANAFLKNNDNLIHLILLTVFLLLSKKLFLGRF